MYMYVCLSGITDQSFQQMNMKTTALTSTSITFAFATIVIAWMLIKLLNWLWFRPKNLEKWLREQGFSGNSYRFLHGDTKEMSRMIKVAETRPINLPHDIMPRILPFESLIINKYGKKSFIWNGPIPNIYITDPKLIRDVFFKHDIFRKPNENPFVSLLVKGMVTYEGEKWFKARKIANPAFHHYKLKDMFPKIYRSCSDIIMRWKVLVSNQKSHELNVWPHIQALTADVISRTAFGSSYDDGKKIFELLRIQAKYVLEVVQSVYIPGWRFLPTKTNRRMRSNYKEMRDLIKGIINNREEALSHGAASNDDLLGILMESNHIEIQTHGKKENGMSVDEIIDECKLFYLAGQETTASLLIWTLILLCMHPHWQALARQEVFQIFGNDEPKFDDLNKLKVITKILHEVLRLFPPVSLLSRISSVQTKLGEINVPPGIMLSIPILLVHQDHEYWGDDAKDFNPNRFSEGVSKASKNNEVPFFPFGWGPRICLGQNFALMEAKLALAMILQNFSLELSPAYIHAPARGVSIQPQFGAPLMLYKI